MDLYYEGLRQWDVVREAAAQDELAFEVGSEGEARFVADMHTGQKLEIIYWAPEEFDEEPGLFQRMTQIAVQLGAVVRRMTRDGKEV